MNNIPDNLQKCLIRLGFHERECSECGKTFDAKDEYVYKILSGRPNGHAAYRWFCSWHCIQQWRAEHDPPPRKPRKKQTKRAEEVVPLVLLMLQQGFKGTEIAKKLDISITWVSRIKRGEVHEKRNENRNGKR